MDEADYAQQNEEFFREEAIKKQRNQGNVGACNCYVSPHSPVATGICCDCDEAIPMKRLKAAPNALRCIECQTKHERGARRG